MNILVPINDEKLISKYVSAGANELYMGFYDDKWTAEFGKYSDINRMSGFKKNANKYNFASMIDIIKQSKKLGVSIFVTLNANIYSKDQLKYIEEEYFPALREAEVDGVIVSELELGKIALEYGLKPVASTMCAIYNIDIVKIYKDYGINRVILPRDLSLKEIESITTNVPDIDVEVFFMRNGCVFSDCYCLGMHRPECGSTCGMLRTHKKDIITTKRGFRELHNIELNDEIYNRLFHNNACAMCALYGFKSMNVCSLKIVGRADDAESVLNDIEVTRRNIDLLEHCTSEDEYLDKMALPFDSVRMCSLGLSCYYPEVRFKRGGMLE